MYQNALAAGAPPRAPLTELTVLKADLGMFSMFGRTGPQKGVPQARECRTSASKFGITC